MPDVAGDVKDDARAESIFREALMQGCTDDDIEAASKEENDIYKADEMRRSRSISGGRQENTGGVKFSVEVPEILIHEPDADENPMRTRQDSQASRARSSTYSPYAPGNAPTVLTFSNLRVTTGSSKSPKLLLKDVSGTITGRLTALYKTE